MNRRHFLAAAPAAALAGQTSLVGNLRRGHPRLVLLETDSARLLELIRGNPGANAVFLRLQKEAESLQRVPPVQYKLVGPRLLAQSRLALDRISKLALVWRLTGDFAFLKRALVELQAAAAFPNWNPSHFLDTAEMTHAFALGYDWLYPALESREREWITGAIVTKGLDPGLAFYDNRRGWVNATHNWNQVCNGGMLLGALAVADEEPGRAERIFQAARQSLPLALASYAPDGGWNEGPGYWHYATRYTVYLLAGLETALGSPLGFAECSGFPETGQFRVYFNSPLDKTFNFADGGETTSSSEELFWLARYFRQPVYAWEQRRMLSVRDHPCAWDLIWYPTSVRTPQEAGWPLDAYYRGIQTAFLRGAWNDPRASWLAAKGGDNQANHSHLDLGSFVFDALGVRWALDLGADDYNLPGYFGAQRWDYYRLRTESHNTVLVDNENQSPQAAASCLGHAFASDEASVTFQLAAAYPGRLTSHKRTVSLVNRRAAIISDEVEASRPVELLWGMVTPAEVRLETNRASLRMNGEPLRAVVASPPGARFDIVSTQPQQPQRQNEGTRKLVVRLPGRAERASLQVRLEPGTSG